MEWIRTSSPIWEKGGNFFSLISGSYCWMTGTYAIAIPHPPWLVGSILILLFLASFINLILRTTAKDMKTLLLYESPMPFVFKARKNRRGERKYFPKIIVI